MLNRDLAEQYNVETRVLNQSIKRNIKRFPKIYVSIIREIVQKLDVTKCDIKLGR